jgi:PTH1 family peptidyl-tRNA hydrolase
MALLQFFQSLFRRGTPPGNADVLFFGLGNRGSRYALSRHNIGFRIADALAERVENSTKNWGCFAEAVYLRGTLFEPGKKVAVVKPHTFMNRSGDAVANYLALCRCPASNALVLVDDYNLPLGTLRARRNGSDGGHNGLKSIIGRIGGNFPRLRVGIGPAPHGEAAMDFVLGFFTEAEEQVIKTVLPRAVDACMLFAKDGIDAVMNNFNS